MDWALGLPSWGVSGVDFAGTALLAAVSGVAASVRSGIIDERLDGGTVTGESSAACACAVSRVSVNADSQGCFGNEVICMNKAVQVLELWTVYSGRPAAAYRKNSRVLKITII